jgi:hypothetical protein
MKSNAINDYMVGWMESASEDFGFVTGSTDGNVYGPHKRGSLKR